VLYSVFAPLKILVITQIFMWFLLNCVVFLCLGFGENTNYQEHQLITSDMWILNCKTLIL
jgi:hypothetical protein